MPLAESYAIGPAEPPVRDITLGQLLEEAVADAPDRLALIAGTTDPAARRLPGRLSLTRTLYSQERCTNRDTSKTGHG